MMHYGKHTLISMNDSSRLPRLLVIAEFILSEANGHERASLVAAEGGSLGTGSRKGEAGESRNDD